MSEITLPESVKFFGTKQVKGPIGMRREMLCFKHAVLQAVAGVNVKAELSEDSDLHQRCDLCAEGK